MAKKSHTAGHFELVVEGHSVGRFEALLAAMTPGALPRRLQPQELPLLLFLQGSPPPPTDARAGTANDRTVVLKHGRCDAMALRRWSGNPMPRELMLVVLGDAGQPVARYHFEHAWPSKWYVPSAAREEGEVAIEEIVIAYEGLRHG